MEIKARIPDPDAMRRVLEALADGRPESLAQTDTFFGVQAGRLKLREQPGAGAELIYYQRPDAPGPAESHYLRGAVADAPAVRALLGAALGVRGQVRKRRLVYHVGRTRVHLDAVEGLGDFLELEVVLAEGEPVDDGLLVARRLVERLGIPEVALVPEAYVDLSGPHGPASGRAAPRPR